MTTQVSTNKLLSSCTSFLRSRFVDRPDLQERCLEEIKQQGIRDTNWFAIVRKVGREAAGVEAADLSEITIGENFPSPSELEKELQSYGEAKPNLVFRANNEHDESKFTAPPPRKDLAHRVGARFDKDAFLAEVRRVFVYDDEILSACREVAQFAKLDSDWHDLLKQAKELIGRN